MTESIVIGIIAIGVLIWAIAETFKDPKRPEERSYGSGSGEKTIPEDTTEWPELYTKWDTEDDPFAQDRAAEEHATKRHFSEPRKMRFEDYIGQIRHIERLKAAIYTAQTLNEPLEHCAFIGSAGTGKTALAACCAEALQRVALMTTGSALNSMEVVADLVSQVNGGIAFIDEAHDLKLAEGVVSGMLPLLEDWKLSTSDGSRDVDPFTCILATTAYGDLDKALRSRMGLPYELDNYNESEMKKIVQIHARRLNIQIEDNAAEHIAVRARKNPRESERLLLVCRSHAVAAGKEVVDIDACMRAFKNLRIDRYGLRESDRKLLALLLSMPKHACAIGRCAGFLGMDRKTFEDTVAMYLFKEGYIITSHKGKELTDKGKQFIEGNTNLL